jgi:hypothetical protein
LAHENNSAVPATLTVLIKQKFLSLASLVRPANQLVVTPMENTRQNEVRVGMQHGKIDCKEFSDVEIEQGFEQHYSVSR